MPDDAPLTFDEQELRFARICLQARGWTITDTRMTDGELILIATRHRTPQTLTTALARDME